MAKRNGKWRAWTSEHVRARPKKDACWKDCSVVKEDGGRNPAESL
jgi:hypothetical protein